MNDKFERHGRYLYQIVGDRWVFGPKGGTKLIRNLKGLEDLVTAQRHSDQCVVRVLMGIDNAAYVPSFGGEKSLDKRYKREIQKLEVDLIDNIKEAEKEYLFDEASEYQAQLDDIQRCLGNDFISAGVVRNLYDGDVLVAFTHAARQRKRRMLAQLRKKGFAKEADDLSRSFCVHDRNIVFLSQETNFEWILKPD